MNYHEFEQERFFRRAWEAVEIVRPVHYSLFTFGESVLPYFLVVGGTTGDAPASVTRGDVRIKRPMIITPDNCRPEFRNFFDSDEQEGIAHFLIARSAHFSNLQFDNQTVSKRVASEGLQATLDKLNRQLDDQEEDQIAILAAPPELQGVAVLRYTAERVWQSAPDNIQELRERGFLP